MARNSGKLSTTCALDGCDLPVVQKPGGGRPRLYCSDAHRAEARRRRLGSAGALPGIRAHGSGESSAGGQLEDVRALLMEAVAGLDQVQSSAPRDDALLAAIRAEATAEVLRAQQAAADAARQAAASDERLSRERGEWQSTVEELTSERAEHLRGLEELSGAFDGARAELEQELLVHHGDAEQADALLRAHRAAHAADMERVTAELDELRQRLVGALCTAEHAEERARRAEQLLTERVTATVELEVRAARAEEQSRQAVARVEEAGEGLARLRAELASERRHHRAVEAEFRRRIGKPSGAGANGSRRRSPALTSPRTTR